MKRNYLKNLTTRLIPENKPVIFWDTCSLLDILRLPYRQDKICYLNNYIRVRDEINSGNLISVTSELVFLEYQENFPKVYKECENEIRKNKSIIEYYSKFLNQDYSNTTPIKDIPLLLQNIVDEIWGKTNIILGENLFVKFAHIRTINKLAPAHKKGEYKDCYIWGSCLQLAKQMNMVDILYFTTNTTDYYFNDNNQKDSQIETDCLAHSNVKIKRNIGEIIGELNSIKQPITSGLL